MQVHLQKSLQKIQWQGNTEISLQLYGEAIGKQEIIWQLTRQKLLIKAYTELLNIS